MGGPAPSPRLRRCFLFLILLVSVATLSLPPVRLSSTLSLVLPRRGLPHSSSLSLPWRESSTRSLLSTPKSKNPSASAGADMETTTADVSSHSADVAADLGHKTRLTGGEGGGGGGEAGEGEEGDGFLSRSDLRRVAQGLAVNGTVFLLVCDSSFMDLLANWVAFAEKLGFDKHFLVVVEDAETLAKVHQRWPGHGARLRIPDMSNEDDVDSPVNLGIGNRFERKRQENREGRLEEEGGRDSSPASKRQVVGEKERKFNSAEFKALMYRRVFYVRELLLVGVDVLMSDVDVVLLGNPFPYLRGKRAFDVVGVFDKPEREHFFIRESYRLPPKSSKEFVTRTPICGGFLYFRNNPGAWIVLDILLLKLLRGQSYGRGGRVQAEGKGGGDEGKVVNDQTLLNDAVWEALQLRPHPSIGVLPQQLFVPGWLYFNSSMVPTWRKFFPRTMKLRPIIVHGNWIMGAQQKIDTLRANGLWALDTVQI